MLQVTVVKVQVESRAYHIGRQIGMAKNSGEVGIFGQANGEGNSISSIMRWNSFCNIILVYVFPI